jgi:predicted nucleotidyltransferase
LFFVGLYVKSDNNKGLIFGEIEMTPANLGVEQKKIVDFCRRWKIKQLAVFGSAVRGQLRPDSDLDLLVAFDPNADWSMFDHYRMENDLVELFAREVDLISRQAVEENPNWICRKEILNSAKVIYAT